LGDLHGLVSLFIRNDACFADAGIPSIRDYIARAERLDAESLSPEHLFDLLDRLAVRRTRRFVREHYPNETIPGADGTNVTIRFPTPALHRLDYALEDAGATLLDAVTVALDDTSHDGARTHDPGRLVLARYTPGLYRRSPGQEQQYQLSNAGLLRSALLKCLESSPATLLTTLNTLSRSHEAFLSALDRGWVLIGEALRDWIASDTEDLESHIAWLDSQEKSGEPRCDICRRDPHFRFVPADDDWRPLAGADGEPIVEAETLQALIAADPLRENTERELSPAAYDGAFDAWDLARRHVWHQWMRLTDPVNLQPDVPKAFRDASELLHRHGAQVLGTEDLDRLIACFNTVPSARVQREVRALLNRDDASETKVGRLRDLARNLGLRPPEPVDPLPPVEEDEVHLLAWMAVRAGHQTD